MKTKHTSLVYVMLLSVIVGFSLYILHMGFIGAPGGYHTTHLSSPKRPAEPPKPAQGSQQDPISLLGLPHPFTGLNYEPGGNGGQKKLRGHVRVYTHTSKQPWAVLLLPKHPLDPDLGIPPATVGATGSTEVVLGCVVQSPAGHTHELPWQMSHLVTTGCGG